MCLIVFSYKSNPKYPFLLIGNRDEFYKRPTEPAHIWKTDPPIIAGKDLKAGGTWLGFTKSGRFAALTNFRDLRNLKDDAPTRGRIITDFLLSDEEILPYLEKLNKKSHQYNGFNLIAGTFNRLYYLSSEKDEIEEIEPGLHAISNAYLNTPWPKTEWAAKEMKKETSNRVPDEEDLFTILTNSHRYPLEELPDTGLSDELEQAVSSVFILTENYGTRSSSIVSLSKNSELKLIERTFRQGTKEVENEVSHSIQL